MNYQRNKMRERTLHYDKEDMINHNNNMSIYIYKQSEYHYSNNTNNMNSTITQHSQSLYTLLPVISGKQVQFETKEEQAVKYYDKLIHTIIKVIEIQYITHCMDNGYQLIMIHGAGDTLIHIIPSNTLRKHLLKQKDKMKSIKTSVICVKQSIPLMNRIMYYETSNLIIE